MLHEVAHVSGMLTERILPSTRSVRARVSLLACPRTAYRVLRIDGTRIIRVVPPARLTQNLRGCLS